MTITARYASTCTACHRAITPGQQIEWSRGSQPRHTTCPAAAAIGTQASAMAAMGIGGASIIAGEIYKPDASATTLACARCGRRPAAWIGGAGRALCARHQDDY